jgi:long-chain acyl-CoA synthetase
VWWIAEDDPDRLAVVESPSGSLTFGELVRRANHVSNALVDCGLSVGDVVAYALPNDVDIVVWQLATSQSGFRSLALNPTLSAREVSAILDHADARALVVHGSLAGNVPATDEIGAHTVRIAVGSGIPDFVDDSEFLGSASGEPPANRILGAPINYSSGTTGRPKGIWRPAPRIDPSRAADAMKTFGRAFSFTPMEGVHLVSAGMHHGGCQGFYLGALNIGQALAIMGKFDPEQVLGVIERCRVTTAYMVPTQFVRLLRLPEDVRAKYDVSSLEVVVHSAAPCPADIKRQMMEWWGPIVWETYGGMEGPATIAKPHRWLEKPGTVGRAIRGVRLKILDDDGNEVSPNQPGHIYIENDSPRFEYRNDPDATAAAYRGNAFTLGDIGHVDEDGYLFISDRVRDIIISGGVNIYPAEVEAVLLQHPHVADVAVIGIPDAEWGEQVRAVVQPTGSRDPSQEFSDELIAFCRDRLAGFKCPRTVEFRSELPRTEAGKLVKRLIRDEFWAGAGRKV